jgi:molecular chaperone GrpE (heat shock protein)
MSDKCDKHNRIRITPENWSALQKLKSKLDLPLTVPRVGERIDWPSDNQKTHQAMKSANQEQAVAISSQMAQPKPENAMLQVPQPAPDNIMAVIARAAADPNVDVGKMERLLAMIREEDKRVAEQLFNAAMARAQAEMPLILKKATNPSTNSKFAKLEAIAKAILPVVEKHNFSLQFSEGDSPKPDKIRVVCKVSHAADLNGKQYSHSEIFHMDLSPDDTGAKGSPTKTKIHGEGSTFSYGRRYLTCMIFNLTIIGEDDDGNQGHRPRVANPSSLQPSEPSLKDLAGQLWKLLLPVRGTEKNWNKANEFCWKNELLDGAVPESAPDLSKERFEKLIQDAKNKLAELGI